MAQVQEDAIDVLVETYAKVVSKPTIDMTSQEIESRGEVVHDIREPLKTHHSQQIER